MIGVIADDFTGAAELAGVGLRFGLRVEVQTEVRSETTADLLVVDTDSRSAREEVAAARVRRVLQDLAILPITWLYKKTDSVLRGHVLAELHAAIDTLNAQAVLLVPANPSAGRAVVGGRYFIDGQPLHRSDFANDPEFPARTSDVKGLLGDSGADVVLARPMSPIPEAPVVVGEVSSSRDVQFWARCLTEKLLPAGGVDFFRALLRTKGFHEQTFVSQPGPRTLSPFFLVSGSASKQSRRFLQEVSERGIPVCRMPCAARAADRACLQQWLVEIEHALARSDRVVAAIGQSALSDPATARELTLLVAEMVQTVFDRWSIRELILEGGATASRVIRTLGWQQFQVTDEVLPGVVRMRVRGKSTRLTVKPGSYPLPLETLENWSG